MFEHSSLFTVDYMLELFYRIVEYL